MKKSFIIVFCLGFFAILPSFLQSLTTYAQTAGSNGGACINGWTGTCGNRYGSCNGTWTQGSSPWPCPNAGNDIWCCQPRYSISGTVYYDNNANGIKDSGEAGLSGITVSNTIGTTATTNSSGQYSFTGLTSFPTTGYPYGISVSNLPANYKASVSPVYLYLENQNRTVDFPIVSTIPPSPSTSPSPSTTPPRFNQSTTTPGIIFTGNGTSNFGRGQASVRGWVVGGLTYPEVYNRPGLSTISYQYLWDKIQDNNITHPSVTTLSGCSRLDNCTLPANIARGVYHATGDLVLNAATFPPNSNYVFLVNGDLTLRGNITVPNGTTVFFSANRDIIIPATVGASINTSPLPDAQIQGIFVANRNFTIQGINNCVTGPDRMLNVEGAIVTNASGTGGTFTNNRDLCGDNPRYPSFTIRSRIDMLLNLPPVLMQQKTTIREDAP